MKIEHTAIAEQWINNLPKELHIEAKTLIIGSFNPDNKRKNTDFYYGRCLNYFWKAIADINDQNEHYYFNRLDRKIDAMRKHKFYISDLINSIELSTINKCESIIEDFAKNKIFSGFSDSVIFSKKLTYKGEKINIKRNYNPRILEILNKGNYNRVIHTLGNRRISLSHITKPLELDEREDGFKGFWDNIQAKNKDVTFVKTSYSTSAYAVNILGDQNYVNLRNWLKENIEM